MFTVLFLLFAVTGITTFCLVCHRLWVGNTYSNVLGITSLVFFGIAYTQFETLIEPRLLQFDWFAPNSVKLALGSLFWFSVAYLANALIKHFIYPRKLNWMGDSTVPKLIQYLVTILLYLLALILILGLVFGQSITGVVTASGAVLLVLGYSARSLLDEFFAGLAVNLSAPFEKGDLIQLNDEWGYVKDVDWRSITYQDMDNNYVTLPNTKLAASKIRNLDRPSEMTRRTLYLQVEYNVPPKVVVSECNDAIEDCPHITPHPWNFCSYFDCDEKGMRYKLHFHVAHYDDWYVASDELLNAIWYRFARKGIRFAHQRKLNFMDKSDEQRVLPDSAWDESNWRALVERFNQVPVFEGMDDKDTEELARSASLHIIGPPERIIRIGSKRTSMFLIAAGSAEVFEVDEKGVETKMASVGESETLGLMSLLTGIPQRTTIRAKEECAVWEIGSDSLHALFDRKPEIMKSIAENVARWRAEEDDAIKTITNNRQQQNQYIRQHTDRLSNRIATFFQRGSQSTKAETGEEFTNF